MILQYIYNNFAEYNNIRNVPTDYLPLLFHLPI